MQQTPCNNASFKLGSPLHRASMITKHCKATVPTIQHLARPDYIDISLSSMSAFNFNLSMIRLVRFWTKVDHYLDFFFAIEQFEATPANFSRSAASKSPMLGTDFFSCCKLLS